jgi:hypothetical protein
MKETKKETKTQKRKIQKSIFSGAEIVSLALYIKKEKLLAIGDLHIGQEEGFNTDGVLIPRTNFSMLLNELEKIFHETGKLNRIILLGDVKHEFGVPNNQEWRETIQLIEFLAKYSKKITIIKGNHDNYLAPITKWKNIELVESYSTGKILFSHGNKIINNSNEKIIVIGHEHPAILLNDLHKSEKFKCFIKTRANGKSIVVLPSMNFLSIGSDISREKPLSPYLKNISEFECWVVEESNVFYFGKINRLVKK